MTPENVKKRDVMSYENFTKAYDEARKIVELKKGKPAHPQTHKIKAEGLYSRNDANPYIAAGIPIDKPEDNANVNDKITSKQMDNYPDQHDGKDPLPGHKLVKGQDIQPENVKVQDKAEKNMEKVAKNFGDANTVIKGDKDDTQENVNGKKKK